MHSLVLAAVFLAMFVQTPRAEWPKIQPLNVRVPVNLSLEQITIDLPIKNSRGDVVYHFACRGGSDTYLDSLAENWVGPLMCTLAEGRQATEESLLSEDDSAAWFSRGQFHPKELIGDCGRYPEFGTHRSFRLRGFQLTLDAENVVTNSQGAAISFILHISVVDDATATKASAERPGFLDPRGAGGNCSVVRRGQEPRMCRDANFSWERCRD
jgi:hypothetical protein